MEEPSALSEARRLEDLWAGGFGNEYIARNANVGDVRGPFWQALLDEFPVRRVLEVGCNVGANLVWLSRMLPPSHVFGIDVNEQALQRLRAELPGVNACWGVAREVPFRDAWFDLVFTMGVLIHQPENGLHLVMSEVVRCSRRYVLCGEYFSEETTEKPYRGQEGALFKRDYGRIYRGLFPELQLRRQGFLSRDQGWDDVTYWLFEKPQ